MKRRVTVDALISFEEKYLLCYDKKKEAYTNIIKLRYKSAQYRVAVSGKQYVGVENLVLFSLGMIKKAWQTSRFFNLLN